MHHLDLNLSAKTRQRRHRYDFVQRKLHACNECLSRTAGRAELAAIASKLGHIPTVAEYHEAMGIVNKDGAAIYKYMNFNQIEEYVDNAKGVAA
jgi:aconitase B